MTKLTREEIAQKLSQALDLVNEVIAGADYEDGQVREAIMQMQTTIEVDEALGVALGTVLFDEEAS